MCLILKMVVTDKVKWQKKKTLKLALTLLSSPPKQQGDHRELRGCYVKNTVPHQTGDQTGSICFCIYVKMRSLNGLLAAGRRNPSPPHERLYSKL